MTDAVIIAAVIPFKPQTDKVLKQCSVLGMKNQVDQHRGSLLLRCLGRVSLLSECEVLIEVIRVRAASRVHTRAHICALALM